MSLKQATDAFTKFEPCEGCEFWDTLEERSPNLKADVGRAVLGLRKTVKEGQVLGNKLNPVQKAEEVLDHHGLDQEGIDQVAMARCVLRQLTEPKEVEVAVNTKYL